MSSIQTEITANTIKKIISTSSASTISIATPITKSNATKNMINAAIENKQMQNSLSESSADEFNIRNTETVTGIERRKMWRNEMLLNSNSTKPQLQQQKLKKNHLNNKIYDLTNVHKYFISNLIDFGIRIILVISFIKLEVTNSFRRKIQPEEMWLYKNPRTPSYVAPETLIVSVILAPFITVLLHLLFTKDRRDFNAANYTWTLILCLNGVTTSLLKVFVGRPRPDFFYRCFPDGVLVLNNVTNDKLDLGTMDYFNCTGNAWTINEGYKSFPSGHASFSFASFGFIAFYMSAKLHTFNRRGRGETWRLCLTLTPLFVAALVAVSRTCDYHHHWQDVLAGSIIGITSCYLCYRQYYPSIFSYNCHKPFLRSHTKTKYFIGYKKRINSYKQQLSSSDYCPAGDTNIVNDSCESDNYEVDDHNADVRNECRPLINSDDEKRNNKWI